MKGERTEDKQNENDGDGNDAIEDMRLIYINEWRANLRQNELRLPGSQYKDEQLGLHNIRINSCSLVLTHLHSYSNEEEEVKLEKTYHNEVILVHRLRARQHPALTSELVLNTNSFV